MHVVCSILLWSVSFWLCFLKILHVYKLSRRALCLLVVPGVFCFYNFSRFIGMHAGEHQLRFPPKAEFHSSSKYNFNLFVSFSNVWSSSSGEMITGSSDNNCRFHLSDSDLE